MMTDAKEQNNTGPPTLCIGRPVTRAQLLGWPPLAQQLANTMAGYTARSSLSTRCRQMHAYTCTVYM